MRMRRLFLFGLVLALATASFLLLSSRDRSSETSTRAAMNESDRTSQQLDRPRFGSRTATPVKAGSGALTIRGRVVDARGPVAGALVTATREEPGESLSARECPCAEHLDRMLLACESDESAWEIMALVTARTGKVVPLAETTSNADGTFELIGLEPGTVGLWGEAGTLRSLSADISAGAQNVELHLEPGRMLRGTVVSEDDVPLAGVALTAVNTSISRFFDTVSASDGSYALGPVPAGAYRVVAWDDVHLTAQVDFAEAEVEKRIVLTDPRMITGLVLLDGVPVAGVEVIVTGTDTRQVSTREDGTFAIAVVHGGHYVLTARKDGRKAKAIVDLSRRVPPPVVLSLARPGMLVGSVRDGDGTPIAGASVGGYSDGFQSTKTNSEGRYAVELSAGHWPMTASADGFISSDISVQLVAGGESEADFTLRAASTVSGIVVDSDGKPIDRASLTAWTQNEEDEGYGGTRADGAFSLSLLPGHYKLVVEHSHYAKTTLEVTAPTSNLRITLDSGGTIRGVVLDEEGEPVGGAPVVARFESEAKNTESATRGGRFEFAGLERGHYTITATYGMETPILTATAEAGVAPGSITDVVLRFSKGKEISGSVVDPSGAPVADVEVLASPQLPPIAEHDDFHREAHLRAHTAKDGRFTLPGATAARYVLRVKSSQATLTQEVTAEPGDRNVRLVVKRRASVRGRVINEAGAPITDFLADMMPVKSADGVFRQAVEWGFESPLMISAEGYAPRQIPVEVQPERELDLGDIVLTRGRTLRGRVVDADTGAPLPGARVMQDPGAGPQGLAMEARYRKEGVITNGAGVFVLENAPAGDVLVAALHPDYPLKLETLSGGASEPTIRLPRGAKVEGRILTSDGQGLSADGIALNVATWEYDRRPANDRGEFSFDALGPGTWRFSVGGRNGAAPERPFDAVEVTVPDRGRIQVELRERTGGTNLVVRAGRTDGQPAQATIMLFPGHVDHERLLAGGAFPYTITPQKRGDAEQTFEALKPGDYSLRVVGSNARTGHSEGYLLPPLKVNGGVAQQVVEVNVDPSRLQPLSAALR